MFSGSDAKAIIYNGSAISVTVEKNDSAVDLFLMAKGIVNRITASSIEHTIYGYMTDVFPR